MSADMLNKLMNSSDDRAENAFEEAISKDVEILSGWLGSGR